MANPKNLDLRELMGKRTIIYGEVGRGKTQLLKRIVETLVQTGLGQEVTVIDMSPPKMGRIGGPLTVTYRDLRYLRPDVVLAPRLQARNTEQVIQYVQQNVIKIRLLLKAYLESPTPILIINDLTIFLQGGDLEELIDVINRAKTFIGTAYYGVELAEDYGSGVSERERRLTDILLGIMDNRIKIE